MLLNYFQIELLFKDLSKNNSSSLFDIDDVMRAKLFLEISIKNAHKDIIFFVDGICEEIFFSKKIFDVLEEAGRRGLSLKIISTKKEERFRNVYSKFFKEFKLLEETKIIFENKELNPFFIIDSTSLFYTKKKLNGPCSFQGSGCFFDKEISARLLTSFYSNLSDFSI